MARPALSVFALVCAFGLTACAGPSMGSVATGVDSKAPGTWAVASGAVGPLALGSPMNEAAATLPSFRARAKQPACTASFGADGAPDLHIVAEGDRVASVLLTLPGTKPDVEHEVGVLPESPRTVKGIGVGSSVTDLFDAFPDIQRTSLKAEALDSYALPDGEGRTIVFGVWPDDVVVSAIQIGPSRTIAWDACGIAP